MRYCTELLYANLLWLGWLGWLSPQDSLAYQVEFDVSAILAVQEVPRSSTDLAPALTQNESELERHVASMPDVRTVGTTSTLRSPRQLMYCKPFVMNSEMAINSVKELATRKVIDVLIPISAEVAPVDRNTFDEFRFEVSWDQHPQRLRAYAPTTQTYSPVKGFVDIEDKDAKKFGWEVQLGQSAAVPLSSQLNLGRDVSREEKYQAVPEHQLLLASGSVQRGTGAFFRFHRSPHFALEGGRELLLRFEVPATWRAGILKIQCQATGERKRIGLFVEPVTVSHTFTLPVFLDGDTEAQVADVTG